MIVVPLRLFSRGGREMIEARHPSTGHLFVSSLDDLDSLGFIP